MKIKNINQNKKHISIYFFAKICALVITFLMVKPENCCRLFVPGIHDKGYWSAHLCLVCNCLAVTA